MTRSLDSRHAAHLSEVIVRARERNDDFGVMMDSVRRMLKEVLPGRPGRELADAISDSLYPGWKKRLDVRQALAALLGAADRETDTRSEEHDNPMIPDDLLGTNEQSTFHRAMLETPEDDTTRLVYADWLEERGEPRADLIRAELALRQNRDFTQAHALSAARETAKRSHALHTLGRFFPDAALWSSDWQQEGRLHRVGPSLPEAAIAAFAERPVPAQVEILSALLRLPEQFADCHALLRRSQLITRNDAGQEGFWEELPGGNQPGSQGIWHPLPTHAESGNPAVFSLLRHLHSASQEHRTALFQRGLQGFDQLHITPRRPVPPMRDALAARLRANAARIPGGLREQEPIWMWNQYDPASENYDPANALVYHPTQFDAQHNGQALQGGYDITLTEDMRVLPEAKKEPVTAGYRSLGRHLRPTDYLDLLHGRSNDQIASRKLDPAHYQGLVGWTPQQYCVANMASLDRSGLPLDQDGDLYRVSYLPGAYFPASRDVLDGGWNPGYRRARLGVDGPAYRDSGCGARVAVRVA